MSHTLDIFQYLHTNAVVLTPNNRLSLHLTQQYYDRYRAQHLGPLKKPRCFSYHAWLEDCFLQISQSVTQKQHPIVLNSYQQQCLWKKIIQSTGEVAHSEALMALIQETWQRCIDWQISAHDSALQYNLHTRRFQKWAHLFQEELKTQQAITPAQIPIYLMESKFSIGQNSIVWTCFDEFTPLQRTLQNYLQKRASPQLFDDYKEKPVIGYRFPAKDQQHELQQAILWTQQKLHEGNHRIALIIPDLESQINKVKTLFSQHFSADLFNISYGQSLSDYPVINTALHCLALDCQHIDIQQLRLILSSPFIQSAKSEFSERSQILQDPSYMRSANLSWDIALHRFKQRAPLLYSCLSTLNPYPAEDTPTAWCNHFKQRLHALGFPGEYPIDSYLYQCLKRLSTVFDEFMSINAVIPSFTTQEALQTLTELCTAVIFQIQKPPSRITILGMLEAAGCEYDCIWISGLTDQCLPQKTKFSPFLPIYLQKKLEMPYTDPQREFIRAQLILARFGYACHTIVYSYPTIIGEQTQLPSILIHDYPMYAALSQPSSKTNIALENYPEVYSLPLLAGEQSSGGTALLASQAKCPFQAFASHRLKIRQTGYITDGLDLAERGQIIHKLMENLWTRIKTQAALLSLSPDALDNLIQNCVQTTLDSFQTDLSPVIQEIEFKRLYRLAHASLDWEKQRNPFLISDLERAFRINLADLNLQIRIDRLDQNIHYGTHVVIDYKTSLPSTKPWLEERPEAPQLLLYALLDPNIKTLIFLQLKAGQITAQGISACPDDIPGVMSVSESAWVTYRQHWETQLNLLAAEIQQGYCEPKPKRSSLCQQCAYPNLCRIASQ